MGDSLPQVNRGVRAIARFARSILLSVVFLGFRFAPPRLYACTRYAGGKGEAARLVQIRSAVIQMNQKAHITFTLNGETAEVAFAPHKTLLEVLREDLGLTGTKHGCELGECGTCTVLVDGRAILSCLMLGLDAEGRDVESIEGMADGADLHPLQVTFADTGAAQCGYCSPGFLLVAKELIDKEPSPTREEIKEALSGNLCRCTGYIKIYEAVELAAARMRGEEMELPRESLYGFE